MAKLRGIVVPLLCVLAASVGLSGGCHGALDPAIFSLNEIPPLTSNPPKNVVLIIGDGMGPEHILAGGFYANGTAGSLRFEDPALFPVKTEMGTLNAWGAVTDSAASATAMAAGRKVSNGTLSLEIPGGGVELPTLAVAARAQGKAVGLVTTDNVCSATPAAFVSHHPDRYEYEAVAPQILDFLPEVLFGGGSALSAADAEAVGYDAGTDAAWLEGLASDSITPFAYGRFGDDIMPYVDSRGGLPTLAAMAAKALDRLEEDPDGFFLLVENELIDEASHGNDGGLMAKEVAALDDAVDAVLTWAGSRTDTLVVVAADHETGGLRVVANNGEGAVPDVGWTTGGHTSRAVEIFARGPDSETFALVRENVDIHRIMIRYFE